VEVAIPGDQLAAFDARSTHAPARTGTGPNSFGKTDVTGKTFHYAELAARIGAVLRRSRERRAQGVLQVGELRIDPVAREVRLGDRKIDLSAKEFALLRTLAAEPTRVFTKEELLRDVWGFPAAVAQ
jgi:DNA-binding response OmpR family regulator